MKIHFILTGIVLSFLCLPVQGMVEEEILAFPGAEGFGAYANGGRGGDVYTVTSLEDSGPGSLRYGIESARGPRTIVFAVAGAIQLKSTLIIDRDSLTIAGQTAPGDGICLRDGDLRIEANHIIIRYIRSRLGSASGMEADAISISSGHHVILDHCSASWSVDECLSTSTGRKGRIDSITIQWCIISEGLNKSIHRKGAHGYGSLIRGCYGARYSYLHNLYAHNYARNPRPGNYDYNHHSRDTAGLKFDFRNNVIYDWGGQWPGYDADTGSVCHYNYVDNYLVPGPESETPCWAYHAGSKYFRAYYFGNSINGKVPEDPWSMVLFEEDWSPVQIKNYKKDTPFPTGPVTTSSSEEAYEKVMELAGASLVRDAVDKRITEDVRNRTGSFINSEKDVGGWPEYRGGEAPEDSDHDGIPDAWEAWKGLDPGSPEDAREDRDGDGYTNLEEYLNELVTEDGNAAE